MSVTPTPPPRPASRFPSLTAAGANVAAWEATIRVPRIEQRGKLAVLLIPGPEPGVLYASEDRSKVDWIDFSIELVVGMIALITGFKLGREGYEALKPLIDELYETDPTFREKVHAIGSRTFSGSPLTVGRAVRDLWVYLWQHHRRALFRAIRKAVGDSFKARRLLMLLVRWFIRLISSGASFLVELGLLVIPLNRKLRRKPS